MFFFLFFSSSLLSTSLGAEHRISNTEGFISFSNAVNSGTSYSGTTVFLDSDIDFSGGHSERFTQIGRYSSKPFLGVFDGQGHTISNLALKSSSYQSTGLFGYSDGLTIQNVVIDGSCSFVSSYISTTYNSFVGGIIGKCYSTTGSCTIKNSVNMASITFNGDTTVNIFIGGIVGSLYSYNYQSTIKDCVNYGSVTHSGIGSKWVEIGGIAGISEGAESSYNYIQNCLNYGTLTHNGTSKSLAIGGIVGVSWYTVLDNCVNSGEISANNESTYIGNIVGRISSCTEITHCYCSEDAKFEIVGYVGSTAVLLNNHFFIPTSFELSEPATIGSRECTSLVDALNAAADYYTLREYSHWLLNKDRNGISFVVDGMELNFTLSSQIILLPSLVSSGSRVFDGWYKDSGYLTPLTDYTVNAGGDMTLYGKTEENTNSYTITFDTRGGTPVSPITEKFRTVVALPSTSSRDFCEFLGWKNEYGDYVSNEFTVPADNIILYASWLCTRITTPEELISFSNAVNDGTSYSGTTVFLDSDIDFSGGCSERFTQIGNYGNMPFLGVFDGQGHTISNLALKSSAYQCTGLFGYSSGLTIQNVVIDYSCSIVSSYSSTYNPFVGGIIGYCVSSSKSCTIENSVNMASVTFNGNSTKNIFVGGVIGDLYPSAYQNTIKNCANYGSVTHSGTDSSWVEMGGIVGISEGAEPSYNYIQNCLNYGTLTHNGTSKSLAIGGIVGVSWYTVLDNCVNSGVTTTNKESNCIGSIIGRISYYTETIHCYWTNSTEYNKAYGYNASEFMVTNSSQVSLNKTTQNELNEYAAKNNTLSKWFMLHMNGGRISNLTYNTLIVTQKHFPAPVREGNTFLFWSKEYECTTQYDPKVSGISGITDLYAGWNISTLTFNFENGTTTSKTLTFEETIEYPVDPEREGYTFDKWDNKPNVMPGRDLIITALWIINNYTLTFIFNNSEDDVNLILNYSQEIEYPADPEKTGYTFDKWDNKPDVMPANDTTITALWTINNYTLKLIFDNGTEPEVRILNYNQKIEYPANPEKEGYTFNGWDVEIDEMPANDTTITVLWTANNYTVTFNATGGDVIPLSKEVTYDSVYGVLPTPTRDWYGFNGWYTVENGKGDKVTESTAVKITRNQTLYANWTAGAVTVLFNAPEGILSHTSRSVAYDGEYGELPTATKEGYTSAGWFTEEEGGSKIESTTRVTNPEQHTLYIHWIINNYTLTFIFNNSEDDVNLILNYSQEIEYPADPEKTGYTFDKWDNKLVIMPADDLIITALWTINNYTVSFVFGNGTTDNKTLNFNETIEYTRHKLSKAFYNFNGWCTEDGKTCVPEGRVPANDIELFPRFTINAMAVSGTVVGLIAFPFLVLLVILLVFILLMIKNGMKIGHEALDVEMTSVGKGSKKDDMRIIKQMEAMKTSENTESLLKKYTKGIEKNRQINEVLDDLGVDSGNNKYGVTESFKIVGVAPTVSKCIHNGTNITAAVKYLGILFANVREQEEFETFEKLYFGSKDVNEFVEKKKDEIISFGCIVSGFRDKKRVIGLLSENEEDNLPRGVLFKVQDGKGYSVEGQDEILIEVNSRFAIKDVEEVIQGKYVVVKLLYLSPKSADEFVNF